MDNENQMIQEISDLATTFYASMNALEDEYLQSHRKLRDEFYTELARITAKIEAGIEQRLDQSYAEEIKKNGFDSMLKFSNKYVATLRKEAK